MKWMKAKMVHSGELAIKKWNKWNMEKNEGNENEEMKKWTVFALDNKQGVKFGPCPHMYQ